jgi:methylated-DNA-[protein]-cysteine S-methyltransferase
LNWHVADFTLLRLSLNMEHMRFLKSAALTAHPGENFAIAHIECGFFWLRLTATPQHLVRIELLTDAPVGIKREPINSVLTLTITQLKQWLNNPSYRFALPTKPHGSIFRHAVWEQITAIPCGETRRYGDLAKALQSSPRAVGQACGDNPLPIIVPCHRVLSATGLGGFNHSISGDLTGIKQWLLAREST